MTSMSQSHPHLLQQPPVPMSVSSVLKIGNIPSDLSDREATLIFALVIDDIINIQIKNSTIFANFTNYDTCITTGKLLNNKYIFGKNHLPIIVEFPQTPTIPNPHPRSRFYPFTDPFNEQKQHHQPQSQPQPTQIQPQPQSQPTQVQQTQQQQQQQQQHQHQHQQPQPQPQQTQQQSAFFSPPQAPQLHHLQHSQPPPPPPQPPHPQVSSNTGPPTAAGLRAMISPETPTSNGQSNQSTSPTSNTSPISKDIPELSLLARVPPPANPADQNPPCNTLYVGNLPPDATEVELRTLFQPQKGFRRLSFRTKNQQNSSSTSSSTSSTQPEKLNASHNHGPMCFVEFEDVAHATRALAELYGRALPRPNGGNGKGGIRLSFSKNPLGVRGPNNPRRTSTNPINGQQ